MQAQCCHRAALDRTAAFCDDCGQPLLRCPAFEECGGLLDSDGCCEECVAPELALDADGVRAARVGGALSLPLIVTNASRARRPLFVKGLWTREAGGDWRAVEVPWERLDAGTSAPIAVRAEALERAGVHQLEIALAVATRHQWREEVLAFTTGLALTVEGEEALTVQQNITYAADAPQTGATIYAPLRVQAAESPCAAPAAPKALPLTRASRLERALDLRGYDDGTVVPRTVRVVWRGFGDREAPPAGPIGGSEGLLTLGRSRARVGGGTNDARLLALAGPGDFSGIDEAASRGISRQHFGLCVENARLVLRVESDLGAWINGEQVPRGTSVLLRDGDRFSPIARTRGCLAVRASFESHHGVVETVTLTRF
ncbi:MAG: FHA domain-containing protein [bacterium]|nr:FHA domain-containing protein [bacterium]